MKTLINIKADKAVKEEAQKIAEELGLSLSAVMNASLKQFIRNKALHLEAAPQMTEELEKYLGEIEDDIKTGKNISPWFTNAGDAIRYLNEP